MREAVQPVMDALGQTVLSTPDLTGNSQVRALWMASLVTANGIFVLFVIAGASSLTYRDPDRAPAKICRELGVRYLLEGSIRKAGNRVRVTVKLVAATGIGAIAAGVAKAKADVILVAGNVGGTGASSQTSVKYAGGPWEMGLSEANQVLTLNNLRHSVVLRTDGGIRTGRDVVIAAMLGAEEFGIGTASLVAMGCIMVRQCHSNTCPVGVCTQDEALRAKFTGTPEKVINLFSFVAEEVREILAGLGFRSLQEIVGRFRPMV